MFTVLSFDTNGNFELNIASRLGYDSKHGRLWFKIIGDDNTYYYNNVEKTMAKTVMGVALKQSGVDLRKLGRYAVELPDYMIDQADDANEGPSALNKFAQSVGTGAKTIGAATSKVASGFKKSLDAGLAKAKAENAKRAAEAEQRRKEKELAEAERKRIEEEKKAKEEARRARREALAKRHDNEEIDNVVSVIKETEQAVAAAVDAEMRNLDFDDIAKNIESTLAHEYDKEQDSVDVPNEDDKIKEITQLRLDVDLNDLDLDEFLSEDTETVAPESEE